MIVNIQVFLFVKSSSKVFIDDFDSTNMIVNIVNIVNMHIIDSVLFVVIIDAEFSLLRLLANKSLVLSLP